MAAWCAELAVFGLERTDSTAGLPGAVGDGELSARCHRAGATRSRAAVDGSPTLLHRTGPAGRTVRGECASGAIPAASPHRAILARRAADARHTARTCHPTGCRRAAPATRRGAAAAVARTAGEASARTRGTAARASPRRRVGRDGGVGRRGFAAATTRAGERQRAADDEQPPRGVTHVHPPSICEDAGFDSGKMRERVCIVIPPRARPKPDTAVNERALTTAPVF
jgi:hypothetical protein